MIYQFVAHKSPGKSRIYALARDPEECLEAVTSLGAGDLHLTDDLVTELNTYLVVRDEAALAAVLERAPGPVRMAVERFVREKCAPELVVSGGHGPDSFLREAYFAGPDNELEEYLKGAYMIGLGIRMTNEIDSTGEVGWTVELYKDEVFVPASSEPRTWALPEGVGVRETWTSLRGTGGSPVRAALDVARKATNDGYWFRLHTILQGDGDKEIDCISTSEFVVDIFDTPIPLDESDD